MKPAPRPIAIVTGASRVGGIGAAIAEHLAAAGWDLFLTGHEHYDRTEGVTASAATDGLAAVAELVSAADPNARVESLGGDLVDPEASQRILDACRTRLGAPRALVNNAALSRRGTLAEAGPADLDDHWRVNARAPILLTAAFARAVGGTSGAVVNLTSGQGLGARRIAPPSRPRSDGLASRPTLRDWSRGSAATTPRGSPGRSCGRGVGCEPRRTPHCAPDPPPPDDRKVGSDPWPTHRKPLRTTTPRRAPKAPPAS